MSQVGLLEQFKFGTLSVQDMTQGLEILCQYAVLRQNHEVASAIQTCLCDMLMMELRKGELSEENPYEESLSLFDFVLEQLVPMI